MRRIERCGSLEFAPERSRLLSAVERQIQGIDRAWDNECNRTFARTVNATYEFDSDDLEIIPPIFPIESVTKFEPKENETDGWMEQTDVAFVIRKKCIISLATAAVAHGSAEASIITGLTNTGLYTMSG
jgi:hypothetical protein